MWDNLQRQHILYWMFSFTHSFFFYSLLYLCSIFLFPSLFPPPLFWFLFSLSNSALIYVLLYQLLNLYLSICPIFPSYCYSVRTWWASCTVNMRERDSAQNRSVSIEAYASKPLWLPGYESGHVYMYSIVIGLSKKTSVSKSELSTSCKNMYKIRIGINPKAQAYTQNKSGNRAVRYNRVIWQKNIQIWKLQ